MSQLTNSTADYRFIFTSKFLWDSSCITFGLPIPGELPLGHEDIKAEAQSDKITNKIDPKKGMSFPDWLTDFASDYPQIGWSAKVAIATIQAVLEAIGLERPVVETTGKKGKPQDKNGGGGEAEENSKCIELALNSIRMIVEVEKENFWTRWGA